MQWIKYKVKQCTIDGEDVLINKKVGFSSANLAIAKTEAYNGEYEIIEDGKTYDKEPLPISLGGTGAKTADEACKNIGGINTYTQSSGALTGIGLNGKFKATATGTYTAFTIGGVSYAVKAGSETEIELTSGVWYSFILDTGAKTINFKAGGAGLNFKIVGGTTQPTSPKENTIWINTDVAIGEWLISKKEPTTRADGTVLHNGDLWIESLNYNDVAFNALKKNGIEVFPSIAKQWNGTQWIVKDAKLYQNGIWKNLVFYIIQDGKLNVANAGSLISTGQGSGTLTYANDYIQLKTPNGSYSAWVTEKVVPFSRYNTLYDDVYAKIETAQSGECLRVGMYGTAILSLPSGTTARQVKKIDITSYTTDDVLCFAARAWVNGDKGPATICHYNVWLG